MSNFLQGSSPRALAIGIAFAALATSPAAAQQVIVVPAGTTDTTPRTVGGTDSVTVQAGGTLSTASNPTINWSMSSTDLRITNSGIIRSTGNGGRAIGTSGSSNARTVTLVNNAGALIESQDDAFRINVVPTSGTIRIDNFGIIRTTNGGQALDFDGISGGATVIINNYAGAELRSFGQDAIRPGQGAVVTNAGLIFSDGAPNNSYDGVDWQARSGTVINQASGTISGLRHGITSDVAVTVTNAGIILGRNGSGIGSDGTGTVVNTGTITGQWDGVAINGDGDGVDIDFIGSVTNSGIIQGLSATGVDSGGRPNSAEGIAMGGGSIVNNAGALVFGAGNAVLINHDTNPGGVADGATTITNAGTIRAGTGYAVRFVGTFNDTVTNSGTITGGTAGAIDLGDGDDTLALLTGSVITGSVSGGAGTDRVTLGGTGSGSFAGATGFELLVASSGSWTLSGSQSYAGGTSIAALATLIGNTGTLTGSIANNGTLVFDQSADGSFGGTLGGTGQLVKAGAGALTIGNQTAFTGATSITGGRIVLAGTLPSAVAVANGGTLAGNGTVASLSVATGGTVAPGTSPGTITVTGTFSQAAGSTYVAETTAAGASDRIVVGGTATIGSGALLTVTRDAGTYTIGQRYTLLTASGGVAGTYTLVQTAAGGTEFRLAQSATGVFVDVARTAAALPALAQTGNQRAVVPAFAALGTGNTAYAALTLEPDDARVRAGLDGVSGEVHASLRTAMLKDAQAGEDAVRTRILSRAAGNGIWGEITGLDGDDEGGAGVANVGRRGWGGFGGVDLALGEHARAGIAGGYTRTRFTSDARASSGTVRSKQVLAYAGGTLGPVAVRASGGYSWVDTAVRRAVAFTGYAATHTADYDGNVLHGLVEAGIVRPLLGGTIEPFAGVEAYRVHSDAFAESAGATALAGRATNETFTLSNLGLRAATPLVERLSARTQLGWQHVLGSAQPTATLQFAGGSVPFTVAGTALSRDSAALSLDLEWKPVDSFSIVAGYSGLIGGNGDDSRFRLTAAIGF